MKLMMVLCLLIAGTVQAEIYKWKDANGMMHYSDQPPKDNKAEVLKTKDLPISTMSAPRREASTASGVAGKNSASAVASAPVAVKSEKNEQACKDAMARLAYLQGSKKFSAVNEKGKLEFMEAGQRKTETATVEASVKRYCP